MNAKPLGKDNDSRWELTKNLLVAMVQGLTRALADVILGRWGKDLF